MNRTKEEDCPSGNGEKLEVLREEDETETETQIDANSTSENFGEDSFLRREEEIENDNEDTLLPPPNYEDTRPEPPKRSRKKGGISTPKVEESEERFLGKDPDTSTSSLALPTPPSVVIIPPEQDQEDLASSLKRHYHTTSLKPSQLPLPRISSYLPMEVYATVVAAFSFLCIGLMRAYTSPAIASMKEDQNVFKYGGLSNTVISWVAASPPLASFFGTILSAVMLQYVGRQKTLVFLTIPYIVGWLLIAFAGSVGMIMAGRALTGLAAGLSTAAAPIYVGECVRARVRGLLGFVPAMMLSLGILLGFALSTIDLEWQDLALLMTCFPLLLFVLAIFVPESPAWLLYKGREDKAWESLRRLRGLEELEMREKEEDEDEEAKRSEKLKENIEKEIESEMEEMKRVLRKRHSLIPLSIPKDPERGEVAAFADFVFSDLLGRREIRVPVFISVSLMVLQQATGANAIIYYLSVILNEADPSLPNATFFQSFNEGKKLVRDGMDPNVASVIFGLVQFLAFFLSLPLIDRVGRRALLMGSALLMIVPHIVLGLYFWVKMFPNSYIHVYKYASIIKYTSGWLPLLCLCAFIASYSIGFGPVPFVIMSEVFPSSSRSYLVALVSLVNHLTLFFIIRVFPTFLDLLGPHIVFWVLACFCFLAFLHVAIFVPETKGKSLAEIELGFKKDVGRKGKEEEEGAGKGEECDCCKTSSGKVRDEFDAKK